MIIDKFSFLENHKHWLNRDCDGWEDMRADLQGASLRGANLRGASLCEANLQGADLYGADLHYADLRRADLRHANLYGADLHGVNLQGADLHGVNLRGANLHGVNLRGANLQDADLDYSCLPLWCGSLSANFDSKQLKQIAYHLVKAGLNSTNATKKDKQELSKLIDYANSFHRAKECGFIAKEMEK